MLVNDLAAWPTSHAASAAAPLAQPSPPGWRPLDVLALVVMIGGLGIGLVMLVGLAVFGVGGWALAGLAGGITAAVGGASVAHLIHRSVDAGRPQDMNPAKPVPPTQRSTNPAHG